MNESVSGGSLEESAQPHSPECFRVLVVDDDEIFSQFIKRLLRSGTQASYECRSTENFDDAIEAMKAGQNDVCLIDIRLGGDNGLDLLRMARQEEWPGAMIVLTGMLDPAFDAQAMELDADDYLDKNNLDTRLLERAIRYAVKARRQTARLQETVYHLEQAKNELQSTQEKLIQSARLETIGILASGVAHELKNPLAVISMGVEYLSKHAGESGEKVQAVLEEISRAVRRAESIANGMLHLSSPRPIEISRCELSDVLEAVALFTQHQLKKKNVQYRLEVEPGISTIPADRNKLVQVLINLFDNAIHAMPEGGTLTLSTARVEEDGKSWIRFCIEDTGCGIPEEKVDQLFDPFYTSRPEGVGTGLGLDIVRRIVKQHGGRVHIENREGGGACVEMRLPLE